MYTIEEFDKQKSKILKYILYKKRTKLEIRNKFSKEIDSELFEDILLELEENGYINDKRYIEKTINEYKILNNLSIKEIKYKLYSKGISNNDIEDYVLNNIEDLKEYEFISAKKIALKKINIMDEINIIKHLGKKGYSQESIRNAIKEIKN